ncbi:Peptidyl-prolyl isomerase FKBP12 [Hordeum vulgare]|nr:Peptidyl-prolyl isomerase FKBP12 [Hordeum vulgare]
MRPSRLCGSGHPCPSFSRASARGTCVWQVLRWAAALGAQGVAEVSVFTQAIESHQRRIPEAILEHALKIFSDKNVEVKTHVVVGDPKEKICEVTTELKVDLLVMGCRAFGPIKRLGNAML